MKIDKRNTMSESDIILTVCSVVNASNFKTPRKRLSVSPNNIKSKCRRTEFIYARRLASVLLKYGQKRTLNKTGGCIGKDHATVLWNINQFKTISQVEKIHLEMLRAAFDRLNTSSSVRSDVIINLWGVNDYTKYSKMLIK